jgi:hypothetical protein
MASADGSKKQVSYINSGNEFLYVQAEDGDSFMVMDQTSHKAYGHYAETISSLIKMIYENIKTIARV